MAYTQTADRLSDGDPGGESGNGSSSADELRRFGAVGLYDGIMQLGGATPEGQQPQVDLMGAQQSIEMLGILAEKTTGNLAGR